MKIVIFAHPEFINSESMTRYADMLVEGMKIRGHDVNVWTAKSIFSKLPVKGYLKKWLGYLDQFFLFPIWVRIQLLKYSRDTLFVFTDHALGPWMNLVKNRPFVVHCHDFMAQKSALGMIRENKVNPLGKLYQKLIRKGYQNGSHFISVSEKTRTDLHKFLSEEPRLSKVVYNGLNQNFKPGDRIKLGKILSNEFQVELKAGFILHVGGNQFYKNRKGVIKIYDTWRQISEQTLPLILIGSKPNKDLIKLKQRSEYSSSIIFLTSICDEHLKLFYQAACVFLFPSLEEGFGWPIAEAMASGCPVVTTGDAPMTEVGGPCAYYIPRMPEENEMIELWAQNAAQIIENITSMTGKSRNELIYKGLEYVQKFDQEKALENIESIYKEVYQISEI